MVHDYHRSLVSAQLLKRSIFKNFLSLKLQVVIIKVKNQNMSNISMVIIIYGVGQ